MRAEEIRVLEALVDAVVRLADGVDDMATYMNGDVSAARRQLGVIKHDIGNLIVDIGREKESRREAGSDGLVAAELELGAHQGDS